MMRDAEYENMAANEETHWWYRTLHERILSSIQATHSGKDIAIVDAACGTGGLGIFLREHGYLNYRGFDLSPLAMNHLKTRGLSCFQGRLEDLGTYFSPASVDVMICADALYFLNEDSKVNFLSDSWKILNDGGNLILNLPALETFSGAHDREVGIQRRFDKGQINALLKNLSYSVVTYAYWPVLLSPLIWLSRKVERKKSTDSHDAVSSSDLKKEPILLNNLLKLVNKLERKLNLQGPFGSSLFISLQKR